MKSRSSSVTDTQAWRSHDQQPTLKANKCRNDGSLVSDHIDRGRCSTWFSVCSPRTDAAQVLCFSRALVKLVSVMLGREEHLPRPHERFSSFWHHENGCQVGSCWSLCLLAGMSTCGHRKSSIVFLAKLKSEATNSSIKSVDRLDRRCVRQRGATRVANSSVVGKRLFRFPNCRYAQRSDRARKRTDPIEALDTFLCAWNFKDCQV